jgi:hypothetical protein
LKDHIDCRTPSGEYCRFTLSKEGRPLSPMAGNFLYVRQGDDGPEVLFCGETDNLALHARQLWDDATRYHAAAELYTRLNVCAAIRQRENLELQQVYEPPMNASQAARRAA